MGNYKLMPAMKTLLKLTAALTCASLAFSACQKEVAESTEAFSRETEREYDIEFSAGEVETRASAFTTPSSGSYPVIWKNNEVASLNRVVIMANSAANNKTAEVEPSSDGRTARFVPTSSLSIPSASNYTFYLMSPALAFRSASDGTTCNVDFFAEQTPTATSVDERSQVLVGKSGTTTEVPSSVNFGMSHLSAYLRLGLANLQSVGTLQKVQLISDQTICGTYRYDFAADTCSYSRNGGNVVTVNTSRASTIWVGMPPVDMGGHSLTFRATGTDKILEKTVTLGSGKKFQSGKIATLTVNMQNATTVVVPTGVSLDNTTLNLEVGETATLTATVTPASTTHKDLAWSSTKPSIATVSSTGVVTAVSPGTARIEVVTTDGGSGDNNHVAACLVTVTPAKTPTGIEITTKTSSSASSYQYYDVGSLHITPNGSYYLDYVVTYSDGSTRTNEGATLSVTSGSGVTLSGRQVKCTTYGKTAVVTVAAASDPSIKETIEVRTWADPTKVNLSHSNPLDNYYKSNNQEFHYISIDPPQARQKFVVTKKEGWDVTATDTQLYITAPKPAHETLADYRALATTIRVAAWHNAGIYEEIDAHATAINVQGVKIFDYIAYDSTRDRYRVIDGGLRNLIENSNSIYTDFECVPVTPTPPSGYKIVAVVTRSYFDRVDYPHAYTIASDEKLPMVISTSYTDNTLVFGFAVGLTDFSSGATGLKWSGDHDDVYNTSYWTKEIDGHPISLEFSNAQRYNAFDLTVAAMRYNSFRGSSHQIALINSLAVYWSSVAEDKYIKTKLKSNNNETISIKPWVLPTIDLYSDILGNTFIPSQSSFLKEFNNHIEKAGGTRLWQSADYLYWTINSPSSRYANGFDATGSVLEDKNAIGRFRPFLVF